MNLDVAVLTWNSAETLGETLQSLHNLIPGRVLIVDRFSTDDTISIAKRWGVEIHRNDLDLANARKFAISRIESEWFVFVDSDVIIRDSRTLKDFKRLCDDSVGWIQSSVIPTRPYWQFLYRKHQQSSRTKTVVRASVKYSKFDYGCLCTFIRTEAAKSWNPPLGYVGAGEDKLLGRHVCVELDYSPVMMKSYVLHNMSHPVAKASWNGSAARRIGFYNLSEILTLLVGSLPYALWASLATRYPLILPYYLSWRLDYLRGWLSPAKYQALSRG